MPLFQGDALILTWIFLSFVTLEPQGYNARDGPHQENASFGNWFWSGGRSPSLVKDGVGHGSWKGIAQLLLQTLRTAWKGA